MCNKRSAFLKASLFAMGFTGLFLSSIMTATATQKSHTVEIPIKDAWTDWQWFGSYIGLITNVDASSGTITDIDAVYHYHYIWPITITDKSVSEYTYNSHHARAKAFYEVGVCILIPWGPFVVEKRACTIYTHAYCYSGDTVTFSDYFYN
ncbi:MAG: hypothetical protein ACTSWL_06405 [Promethearchaeota archaeon]